ncbi:lantibiotic dehydratase [Streptomyces carpaticus]|uniref:Lantibiotic dehydratase n=1 Tax=Streptomyces carpaticus TaxID=285558 RepID=A0ABV4ZHD5_9ACTN
MYKYVDAALVRATTAGDLTLPPWPDLTATSEGHAERWRGWLQQVWANEQVAQAVEVASPSLSRRINQTVEGPQRSSPRQIRRAMVSMTRYLLRMTSRATPFGLFAGVAPVRFGDRLTVRWSEDHRAVAGADAEWLDDAISRLESHPELLGRLPVMANNLHTVRDGRLHVPSQHERTEVSLRLTPALHYALCATSAPIPFSDVAAQLATKFPGTPPPVINGMLTELVTSGVLLTSLRPPMTATDALGHVVDQLAAVRADSVAEAAPLAREIEEAHDEVKRHNRAPSAMARRDSRVPVLTINVRSEGLLVLPHLVAREAEAAAWALTRLTPYPEGSPAWQDYHSRFLERYGIGALVPVTELVNLDTGLGFPAGYRGSLLRSSPTGLSARDDWLLAQAQRAALAPAGGEVVLDDRAIADLAVGDFRTTPIPPHVEVRFHLEAVTREALGRGEFRLVVASVSRAAGTTAGRFLDLLDPADRDRMAREYGGLPTAHDGSLPLQVSSPPSSTRTVNVARAPAVLPRLLSLGEHQADTERLIPLDDLGVTADAHRFSLISVSRRQTVEPTILNAVEFRHHTHPLVRFLCEITTARSAGCLPFSWGAATRLPYLPRMRYRRTVLAPARWNLLATDLPGPKAAWPLWLEHMTNWRHRHHLPETANLAEGDRHIRLDLNESAHLTLLRSSLECAGHVTLYEAPATEAYGWFDDRAHEISVPLVSTAPPEAVSVPRTITRSDGELPGSSDLLFIKLHGHPRHQNSILTIHLPRFIAAWDGGPLWWYVRYRHPEHHLRLRFRLPNEDAYGPAIRDIGTWATGLRRRGLISGMQVDTYFPENGRYGIGPAMTAAEAVFAADSTAAIAQLARTAEVGPHPHAVTAASFVNMATAFTGDIDSGMRWLIDNIQRFPTPSPAASTIDLTRTWATREAALATYRTHLTGPDSPNPDRVLASLLHMHHIRMNGVDENAERTCLHLARSAALAWTARKAGPRT